MLNVLDCGDPVLVGRRQRAHAPAASSLYLRSPLSCGLDRVTMSLAGTVSRVPVLSSTQASLTSSFSEAGEKSKERRV